jgi:hypothetical protein
MATSGGFADNIPQRGLLVRGHDLLKALRDHTHHNTQTI